MEDRPILRKLYDDFQNGRSFDEFIESADEFEKLMSYYWCAVREVETKFRVLDNQLSLGKKRNPIESIIQSPSNTTIPPAFTPAVVSMVFFCKNGATSTIVPL